MRATLLLRRVRLAEALYAGHSADVLRACCIQLCLTACVSHGPCNRLFLYPYGLVGLFDSMSYCNALQTNSSTPIVRQNMDTPAKLGAIFYNSIAQNQSYGVAGMSYLGAACSWTGAAA